MTNMKKVITTILITASLVIGIQVMGARPDITIPDSAVNNPQYENLYRPDFVKPSMATVNVTTSATTSKNIDQYQIWGFIPEVTSQATCQVWVSPDGTLWYETIGNDGVKSISSTTCE